MTTGQDEQLDSASYSPTPGAYDEMYDDVGAPREGLSQLNAAIRNLDCGSGAGFETASSPPRASPSR